jgi:hypothetical protein
MTEYFTFHIWSPVESNIYDECQLYSIYSSFGCPLESKQKSSHPECDITCSGPHHCKIFSQTVSPTKTDEACLGKSNFFAHIVGNVKNSKLSYQSDIPVAGLNVQNRLSTPKKIFGRPWLNILWQNIRSWKTIVIAHRTATQNKVNNNRYLSLSSLRYSQAPNRIQDHGPQTAGAPVWNYRFIFRGQYRPPTPTISTRNTPIASRHP